jgi:hypothetical protein
MKLYRCTNPECSTDPAGRHIFNFLADQPICPKCGADRRQPEHRDTIVPLSTIHFLVVDPKGPIIGKGKRFRAACKPDQKLGVKVQGQIVHGTRDGLVVNCPDCLKTPEWAAYAAENEDNVLEKEDFPVMVDREQGVIKAERYA